MILPRRRLKITPKQQKTDKITQTESLNEVLSSIDSIQTKRRETTPQTPSSVPTGKIILVVIFISIVGLGFLSLGNLENTSNPSSEIPGSSLAEQYDFKIQLLDETEVMLSDYVGDPIILDLMATYCEPCKTQIGYLQDLQSNFPNIRVISVSIAPDYDDISKLTKYKEDNDMNWIVGRDITQNGAKAFSANYIPTLAFINSAGTVKQYNQGVVEYNTLVAWINTG